MKHTKHKHWRLALMGAAAASLVSLTSSGQVTLDLNTVWSVSSGTPPSGVSLLATFQDVGANEVQLTMSIPSGGSLPSDLAVTVNLVSSVGLSSSQETYVSGVNAGAGNIYKFGAGSNGHLADGSGSGLYQLQFAFGSGGGFTSGHSSTYDIYNSAGLAASDFGVENAAGVSASAFLQETAGTTPWGEYVYAVPEPTTLIAGMLLLLPFGASTFRVLRKNHTA